MFMAGAFDGFYSPGSNNSGGGATYAYIGSTEHGFRRRTRTHWRPINTDQGGDAQVDAVNRGVDYEIEIPVWEEYNLIQAVISGANPLGKVYDNVGKLASALAGPLVLKPKAGTTAETVVGVGSAYIFYLAFCATDVEEMLANDLNSGPLTFHALPDPANAKKAWAIITAPSLPAVP